MTRHLVPKVNRSASEAFSDDFDELADYIQERASEDPRFAGAFDDAECRTSLLVALTAARRSLGLTQSTVAERMGTTQSAVSDLEGGAVDARLSTLQRYARAVDRALFVYLSHEVRPQPVTFRMEPKFWNIQGAAIRSWHTLTPSFGELVFKGSRKFEYRPAEDEAVAQ